MLLTDLPPDLITLIATWVPIRTLRPVVRFDALAPRRLASGHKRPRRKARLRAPSRSKIWRTITMRRD